MTVIVVGDVVTDIVTVHEGALAIGSDTLASVLISGGGSAANTAAWLGSIGHPVTFSFSRWAGGTCSAVSANWQQAALTNCNRY